MDKDDWEKHIMDLFGELVNSLQDSPTDSTKETTEIPGDTTIESQESIPPEALWDHLAAQGHLTLLEKLHHVEQGAPGYGTIVVPKEGFSEDDSIHNAVLDWLHTHNVNVLNVSNEISNLHLALGVPEEV